MQNKKAKVKEFFKSFTPYQITYLAVVVLLTALFVIFLPDEMLESTDELGKTASVLVTICAIVAVVANPLCELLISKQSKWNFIVSIVLIEVTESIIYFVQGNYATACISILFWIPIDFASFVTWNKHPDEKQDILTEVKRLTWWQDIIMVALIAGFGFGVGFLLTLIPGAEDTYVDAFCSAVGMANGILLLLRYNEQWIAWIICVVLEGVLYILGGSYIMLITVVAMIVNTTYGFVKWLIYIKKHEKNGKDLASDKVAQNTKVKPAE